MAVSLTRPVAPDPYAALPPVPSFTLTSEDVRDGEPLLDAQWAPPGGNTSPPLGWSGFPAQTLSFVVNLFDPDAPGVTGFWHWFMVDVPARTTSLPRGAGSPDDARVPPGVFQLRGDSGSSGFSGAKPPPGDRAHRYVIAVHALDVEHLGVGTSTMPGAASIATVRHTLARAILVGTAQAA
ncbi:YbhB/YbcL family Raf kinase inhibitor-like protein [Cellulomonas sp. P22]|uniref:YbhB/YbcL family Raf kinase inhibitor-like protein n=1 Tax=Cellulomonas sp. P22 TaxID=3373189 RepID=UPI0037BA524E